MKEYRLTDWLPTTKKEVELRGWDELDIEKSPASVGKKFFIVIIWNIYHLNSSYFPLFIHHST